VTTPDAPPRRPDPPRDAPEAAQESSRRLWHFTLFMVAALITLTLPLPWQVATLAFTTGAVVTGVRAFLAARRAGRGTVVLPLIAAGVTIAAFLSVSMAAVILFWDLSVAQQQCLREALTVSAREACEQGFREGTQVWRDDLVERFGAG
jgi:hypothetical protein